jgi:hypothetical protein
MVEWRHSELTQRIIAGFYEVYSELGTGFLKRCTGRRWRSSYRKKA